MDGYSKIIFPIFNLTFIAIYQNILIFLFASPVAIVIRSGKQQLNIVDTIGTILFLLCVIG
jgi:steroid 5-alpha reductase family enzyme